MKRLVLIALLLTMGTLSAQEKVGELVRHNGAFTLSVNF